MRRFLLISHGEFAKGIRQSLTIFLGQNHPFEAISAYLDDTPVETQIEAFMATVDPEDELIVFSDLNGGSVNQKMIPYLSRPKTHIIAGFNFPILLAAACAPQDQPLDVAEIKRWIDEGQQGVVYVNEVFSAVEMNSDDE